MEKMSTSDPSIEQESSLATLLEPAYDLGLLADISNDGLCSVVDTNPNLFKKFCRNCGHLRNIHEPANRFGLLKCNMLYCARCGLGKLDHIKMGCFMGIDCKVPSGRFVQASALVRYDLFVENYCAIADSSKNTK